MITKEVIMITVRKLINELKKMPQNLHVGVAMHDNGAHEVAGWVRYPEIDTDNGFESGPYGERPSEIPGKRCVVLRC